MFNILIAGLRLKCIESKDPIQELKLIWKINLLTQKFSSEKKSIETFWQYPKEQ